MWPVLKTNQYLRVPGKNEKLKIFPNTKEKLTKVSYTACTTDAMDVFLNVTRQVKIDNVFHVGDVKATCSHLSRQKHNQLNKLEENHRLPVNS